MLYKDRKFYNNQNRIMLVLEFLSFGQLIRNRLMQKNFCSMSYERAVLLIEVFKYVTENNNNKKLHMQ
ncbi:hypothetical protein T4B_14436 [Trichinella pseudospiralis]|uniref:Uncharacterized protein n=1 Tax=Trichinella pseudospiralis TaxID=6337 RepID=A0A0V1HX58_TRIPS|nr:hypothetical protein T4B_14436 [Trichinella pseudospiralis]KRZ26688.1 hypothetical protein T4C_9120 [Trichinella pseudospiralis]